ncbi:MAG TPA: efflux RND transporter periplasmic adaptor subunit [Gammaproteobacteria bacterium]|nr:efflux RND transporter periplasmic adaptor subunit [Gammaproteobacteria bacterium]
MTRTTRRIVLAAAVLALVGAAIWYLSRTEPIAVPVAPAARGVVEETVANTRAGTVEASRRARIAPDISGQVTRLAVSEGDRVEKGAILMELWNTDRRAELELARSQRQAAEAKAQQACQEAEAAAREARRQLQLRQKDMSSEEAVDQAVTKRESARANCRAARSQVKVTASQVDAARARLERTILRAPFTGTVAEVNAELGEIVTPSPPGIPTPPAVDLIDTACPHVSAPIDEVDAPQVKVGMPARIHLDAYPEQAFPGRVMRVAPYVLEAEKQARTVEVEVAFDHPEGIEGLMPGYSADAEIILDRRDDTLHVPTEAITEGDRVLVLGDDGRLHRRPVKTGLSNWERTEITDGLDAGERVVLSPTREGVADGVPAVAEAAEDGE